MGNDRRFPFEKLAKLDSPERRERQPPEPLIELVARARPARVLDVGAGSGYFSLPLAQALPEARIIALDVEARMLEVLRERAEAEGVDSRIETLLAPPDRIPLPNASFDVALLVNLYHELDDRLAYLTELRRVLASSGQLVLCDWDPQSSEEAGPPRKHRVLSDQAVEELRAVGFTHAATHELYRSHYVIIAS